jgi:hypothetical protein
MDGSVVSPEEADIDYTKAAEAQEERETAAARNDAEFHGYTPPLVHMRVYDEQRELEDHAVWIAREIVSTEDMVRPVRAPSPEHVAQIAYRIASEIRRLVRNGGEPAREDSAGA